MDKQQKLIDVIEEFDHAMLVTHRPEGSLAARPMAVAQCQDDGELWFITDRHSEKMTDLEFDDEVVVTMQGSKKFVAISGKASVVQDREKLDELWQEAWKVWFPKGKSSPTIVLLKIAPVRGEYWDHAGLEGVKYLIQAGKAYLQGNRPDTDESINASVPMSGD